jgi:hypothetical protein
MRVIPKIAVLLAALLGSTTCMAGTQSKGALIQILQQQGFTGALTGDIHFTTLGSLHCPGSDFQVVYFEWYGPANPGSHRAQYRILFLEGGKHYVGSYVIADRPVSMRNNSILFGYDKVSGNAITCAEIGPGESVQLDGGRLSFFK